MDINKMKRQSLALSLSSSPFPLPQTQKQRATNVSLLFSKNKSEVILESDISSKPSLIPDVTLQAEIDFPGIGLGRFSLEAEFEEAACAAGTGRADV